MQEKRAKILGLWTVHDTNWRSLIGNQIQSQFTAERHLTSGMLVVICGSKLKFRSITFIVCLLCDDISLCPLCESLLPPPYQLLCIPHISSAALIKKNKHWHSHFVLHLRERGSTENMVFEGKCKREWGSSFFGNAVED